LLVYICCNMFIKSNEIKFSSKFFILYNFAFNTKFVGLSPKFKILIQKYKIKISKWSIFLIITFFINQSVFEPEQASRGNPSSNGDKWKKKRIMRTTLWISVILLCEVIWPGADGLFAYLPSPIWFLCIAWKRHKPAKEGRCKVHLPNRK
jgi:hypothetical protein